MNPEQNITKKRGKPLTPNRKKGVKKRKKEGKEDEFSTAVQNLQTRSRRWTRREKARKSLKNIK